MILCLSYYMLVIIICLQEVQLKLDARRARHNEKEANDVIGNDLAPDLQENIDPVVENEIRDDPVDVGDAGANNVQENVVENAPAGLDREAPNNTSIQPHPTPSKLMLLTISLTHSQIIPSQY